MHFRSCANALVPILTLGLILGASAPAAAQDEAAAEDTVEQTDSRRQQGLEEITVTARKRAEDLQTVPVSISTITARDFENQTLQLFEDIQFQTPGLTFRQTVGRKHILGALLRGFVALDSLITTDPTVGFYIDDIYSARISGSNLSLFDLDRIETLKGPQGVLFGKNNIGRGHQGALQAARRHHRRLRARPSGHPGTDRLRGRGLLPDPCRNPVRADRRAQLPPRRHGGAPSLESERRRVRHGLPGSGPTQHCPRPIREQRARARAHRSSTPRASASRRCFRSSASAPANPTRTRPWPSASTKLPVLPERDQGRLDSEGSARPGPGGQRALGLLHQLKGQVDLDAWGYTYNMTWNFDSFTIRSLSGWRKFETDEVRDADGTPWNLRHTASETGSKQFTQELQITGTALEDRFEYTSGVYWNNERSSFFEGGLRLLLRRFPRSIWSAGRAHEHRRQGAWLRHLRTRKLRAERTPRCLGRGQDDL